MQCPTLECDEKVAFRPDKKACCRQCPATTPRSSVATTTVASDAVRLPRDQALPSTRRTAEEILSSGGCKYPLGGPYENGMEWHPRLHSHGEMKCVKCRCKVRNPPIAALGRMFCCNDKIISLKYASNCLVAVN